MSNAPETNAGDVRRVMVQDVFTDGDSFHNGIHFENDGRIYCGSNCRLAPPAEAAAYRKSMEGKG